MTFFYVSIPVVKFNSKVLLIDAYTDGAMVDPVYSFEEISDCHTKVNRTRSCSLFRDISDGNNNKIPLQRN